MQIVQRTCDVEETTPVRKRGIQGFDNDFPICKALAKAFARMFFNQGKRKNRFSCQLKDGDVVFAQLAPEGWSIVGPIPDQVLWNAAHILKSWHGENLRDTHAALRIMVDQ